MTKFLLSLIAISTISSTALAASYWECGYSSWAAWGTGEHRSKAQAKRIAFNNCVVASSAFQGAVCGYDGCDKYYYFDKDEESTTTENNDVKAN